MLAMMSRSALGHTGRAADGRDRRRPCAFVLVQAAVLLRVVPELVSPGLDAG